MIAAGVVLGLLLLWGIVAGARGVANGNETLQAVLGIILCGLGLLLLRAYS